MGAAATAVSASAAPTIAAQAARVAGDAHRARPAAVWRAPSHSVVCARSSAPIIHASVWGPRAPVAWRHSHPTVSRVNPSCGGGRARAGRQGT